MSLAIDVGNVMKVLLANGKEYDVEGQSFRVDTSEFAGGGTAVPRDGTLWFQFKAKGRGGVMCGPVSGLAAVASDVPTPKTTVGNFPT